MIVLFTKDNPGPQAYLVQFSKDVSLSLLQELEFVQKGREITGGRLKEILDRLKEKGTDCQILRVGDIDTLDKLAHHFKYKLSNGQ